MKKIVLALLLTVVFALPAFSQMTEMSIKEHQEEGHGPGHGPMMGMGKMTGMCIEHADKFGLTDDQITKLKPLHREMQKRQLRFKADLNIAEIDLMEIMEVKDFDLDKANSAVKKIAEMKTAHQLEMLKSMKEIRSILTDEQFKKMKRMMFTKKSLVRK